MTQRNAVLVSLLCAAIAAALLLYTTAHAATRTGIAALQSAIAAITALPAPQRTTAVAAHASQEGHWTLVNAAGEAFTASTPEELKRGWDILLPDLAAAGGKPSIYLSTPTVFGRRAQLGELPRAAELWLADTRAVYLLVSGSGANRLLAVVKPNLLLGLDNAPAFAEAQTLLARPLERSQFRLLALEPAGPRTISTKPRNDPASGRPLVDTIDPNFLNGALSGLRGQTALIAGRLRGDALAYKPAAGGERTLAWAELAAAANDYDVNLLLLKSPNGQQPGGKNWLWQTFEVKGLNDALTRATLADALDALGTPDTKLEVAVTLISADRTLLDVRPFAAAAGGSWSTAKITNVLTNAMSGLVGSVNHEGALAHMRSAARQAELDRRVLPFVPSMVQWVYGGLLLLGLAGFPVARTWWQRVWPPETVTGYSNATGYWAARGVRGLAFVALFLPVAAVLSAPRALLGLLTRRGLAAQPAKT